MLIAKLLRYLVTDHFGADIVSDEIRLGFGCVHNPYVCVEALREARRNPEDPVGRVRKVDGN
jgi:hypothetical protein